MRSALSRTPSPLRAAQGCELVPADKRLAGLTGGQLIGEETRLLLELPAAENPLVGAGDESCFPAGRRGKVLIVWTRPEGQAPAECIVKPGTSVFLFGAFWFCDPLEQPPSYAVGEEAQRSVPSKPCHLPAARVRRHPRHRRRGHARDIAPNGSSLYPLRAPPSCRNATSSASNHGRRRSPPRVTWRCSGRCGRASTRSPSKLWADPLRAPRRRPSTSCPAPEHP